MGELPPSPELLALARHHGVQRTHVDMRGTRCPASVPALVGALRGMGVPLADASDARDALEAARRARLAQVVEPVTVAWEGSRVGVALRLPESNIARVPRCELTLESGETRRWTCALDAAARRGALVAGGRAFTRYRVPLPQDLPWGRHRLVIDLGDACVTTTVLAAPVRAHEPADVRTWGAFVPIHALRRGDDWGVGDLGHVGALASLLSEHGGRVIATLPRLASFLDEPFEPSPYVPVSRLFWNELFLDLARIPEIDASPAIRALVASADVQREAAHLAEQPLVEYRRAMALKRCVLEAVAASMSDAPAERRVSFARFLAERPETVTYARFRAECERARRPWREWEACARDGELRPSAETAVAERYHACVQWLLHEQHEGFTSRAGAAQGLYLDFPLGVHPDGYDTWRHRVFAQEVSAGAPPDLMFTSGQDWGFPPLHPQAVRHDGYAYFAACLRHQMKGAAILRLDHVMAFHRLFWVPRGVPTSEGVYVRYRPDELYAVACIESRRNACAIVGENLGLVPRRTDRALDRHGMQRMHVVQYEIEGGAERALRPPERNVVASINTHDMPPFAAYCAGLDIDDRVGGGFLSPHDAEGARRARVHAVGALAQRLRELGLLPAGETTPAALHAALLLFLGRSEAQVVLVTLEDLWSETEPQNVPGTGHERPNWRRRFRVTMEDMVKRSDVVNVLDALEVSRRAP